MPFPNFHSARVKNPDLFSRIRVLKTLNNGIMIYGGPLKSDPNGPTQTQTYRFPKDKFTAEEAKAWLKRHNIKNIEFEHAKVKKMEKAQPNIDNLLKEGKSKGRKMKVDPEQLKMGIQVEYEHTNDKEIAEKIARDHLAEIPDYYTRLKEMEFKVEKSMKKAYLHVSDNLYIDLSKAIEERKDAPKSVPKEYKNVDRSQFGDSKNYLYPLDNEKHVRAAISYFGIPRNYQKYNEAERKIIAGKIKSAAKKYKIEISEDW